MVLALLLILGLFQNGEPPTVEKYAKAIKKAVKKEFGLTDYRLVKDENNKSLSGLIVDGKLEGYILASEVAACHLGGCAPSYNTTAAHLEKELALGSEYFDVLVLLTPEKLIKKIKILNYFSDYGYEVTSKNYLNKFQSKSVCAFASSEDGIDAISGATISSMALEGILGDLCD